MTPTQNQSVRIKNTAMTGMVEEVGCDKCVVRIDEKQYECHFDELTDPILPTTKRLAQRAVKWLVDANYRFFEDKDGTGNAKVIAGVIIGSILTYAFVVITN